MSYNFSNAITIFKDAVTQQYWDVDGRTSRSDYGHYFSISFLIAIVLNILVSIVPIISIVSMIVSLALLGPAIGMAIRRVHDQNKAWWFALIPFYNIYLLLFVPGDKGTNEFGDDPLGNAADAFS